MTATHSYTIIRSVFLRSLGVIYFLAFSSFALQITGLLGHEGVLPAGEFLQAIKQHYGSERFWLAPTIFWFNSSDAFLTSISWVGAFLSFGLIFDLASGPVAFLLWLFYLSLVVVGQEFMGFQWDALLLETGLLAIFWTRWWPIKADRSENESPSIIILWLLRILLFKLMFSSGLVKLSSGDKTWRDLTALTYHYLTQPLPNVVSWYVYQWPVWFHKLCCVLMFFVELIVPFFIFMGRSMRLVAFGCISLLELIIFLTGNYCFFNLLTITLTFSLLDDQFFVKFFPAKFFVKRPKTSTVNKYPKRFCLGLHGIVASIFISISINDVLSAFRQQPVSFKPIQVLESFVAPLRSINSYGLFAMMTTSRPEIIIEGSMDGETWQEYQFRWKPGRLDKPPCWVAPHQPRLDWQMWFAALGSYRYNQWVLRLLERLLEGSKPVLNLLGANPFPNRPPKYVRALVYDYKFTDRKTRTQTGQWWQRKLLTFYYPPVSLQSNQ